MKHPNEIDDDKLWVFITLITKEIGYNIDDYLEKGDKAFLKMYRQYMHCLPHNKTIRNNLLALAIYGGFFEIYINNNQEINKYHEDI